MIQYASRWTSISEPHHTITAYMEYDCNGVSKYFCQEDGKEASKLIAAEFILSNYRLEK